jgi:hypothetical protein
MNQNYLSAYGHPSKCDYSSSFHYFFLSVIIFLIKIISTASTNQ